MRAFEEYLEEAVPDDIRNKIIAINALLDTANQMRKEVVEWYDFRAIAIDPTIDLSDKYYDPSSGFVVEDISLQGVKEVLATLKFKVDLMKERFPQEPSDLEELPDSFDSDESDLPF